MERIKNERREKYVDNIEGYFVVLYMIFFIYFLAKRDVLALLLG